MFHRIQSLDTKSDHDGRRIDAIESLEISCAVEYRECRKSKGLKKMKKMGKTKDRFRVSFSFGFFSMLCNLDYLFEARICTFICQLLVHFEDAVREEFGFICRFCVHFSNCSFLVGNSCFGVFLTSILIKWCLNSINGGAWQWLLAREMCKQKSRRVICGGSERLAKNDRQREELI